MSFIKHEILYDNIAITATAVGGVNSILVAPIDIRNYEQFALMYQNQSTQASFIDMQVQAAYDVSGTAADLAPNWVQINTATLPQPSALGNTSALLTSAVDNVYSFIRIIGRTNITATAGFFRITVAGRRA